MASPMTSGNIRVQLGGRDWNGVWRLDGRDLCIESAYGSARAPLGRADPNRKAGKLLEEQVADWLRKRL